MMIACGVATAEAINADSTPRFRFGGADECVRPYTS